MLLHPLVATDFSAFLGEVLIFYALVTDQSRAGPELVCTRLHSDDISRDSLGKDLKFTVAPSGFVIR